MECAYNTKVVNHIKSLRYVLIGLAFVLLFCYFIAFTEKDTVNPKDLLPGAILWMILGAPAIFLHISYYIKNFGLKIIIDKDQNTLMVSKFGTVHSYNFSDIISTEQHLAIYHKNRIDNVTRKTAPWTPYGYLLVKFNDGLQVYFTSLMIDVLNPPVITTCTYFTLFPYLKSGIEFSKKRIAVNENYENKISHYKLTFGNHSDLQLNEKIINSKTYDKAAVEAARRLLAIRSGILIK